MGSLETQERCSNGIISIFARAFVVIPRFTMAPKVLIVLTSYGDIVDSTGKTLRQTGWYLPEHI
ncbi:hypothetical protein GGS26DRAFT_328050 [Hypomontagnella submonticulosa]|nr:hypothetical protein GGS26DRAFT_328050 [Hypomontagnella submonticulosa]